MTKDFARRAIPLRVWTGAATLALAGMLGLGAIVGLTGCASEPPPVAAPEVRAVLAPTGVLRVGVYPGSPTSMVQGADGKPAGVAYELGQRFGQWLGVPVQVVRYQRVAEVLEGMKAGEVDFTFTNATESRARDVDFTLPLVNVELGYLVPAGSRVRDAGDIDQPGLRVGVAQGSTSQGTLGRQFRQATVVPVASLAVAAEQLAKGGLDAFATNKGILYELSDQVPGSHILPGRWGLEHMAIAVPRGRQTGMGYLSRFALTVRRDGTLRDITAHAGLRGTVEPDAH